MYLLFAIVGLVIGGFTSGEASAMLIGMVVGIVVAGLIHIMIKATTDNSRNTWFDGCLLVIFIEGIFAVLSE